MSRHGINKGETGPMLRASFEETVEVFMNSAAFSHYDMFNGVTENVMLGQLGKLGTGLVDLLLDQSKLSAAIDTMVTEDTAFDEEVGAADAMFKENGDATPFTTNTPYTNSSPGWIGGSTTPMFGSFTPATATPYVEGSPSSGYLSPYYNPASATSPGIYQSMSPSYVSMSPSRSMAGLVDGQAFRMGSPQYNPRSTAYSPTSPAYSPTSPAYSPTSPAYSPTRYSCNFLSLYLVYLFTASATSVSVYCPGVLITVFFLCLFSLPVLPLQPCVLPHVARVFPDFPGLQPHQPRLLSNLACLFAHQVLLQY